MRFFVVAALLLSAVPAWADDEPPNDVVYRKHTVVDFGDETIEGELSNPNAECYFERAVRMRHRPLIDIRTSFHTQLVETKPL